MFIMLKQFKKFRKYFQKNRPDKCSQNYSVCYTNFPRKLFVIDQLFSIKLSLLRLLNKKKTICVVVRIMVNNPVFHIRILLEFILTVISYFMKGT